MAGNNPSAIDALGFAYETGQGKPKDLAKAVAHYTDAAEAGLDMGLFHLGNCYAKGIGVVEDQAKASKYFQQAAEKGVEGRMQGRGMPPQSQCRYAAVSTPCAR